MTRLWSKPLFLAITLLLPSTLFAQQECNSGPNGRTGFTPVLLNDHIYLAGGSEADVDVYRLDLSQGLRTDCPHWSRPANVATNEQYKAFMNGAAFPGTDGNTIFMQSGDYGSDLTDRMVEYNVSGAWRTSMISGQTPTPRAAMSASINSTGSAFYYGGRSPITTSANTTKYFNDFYVFDTNFASWSWPTITYGWGKAPPRYSHSAVLIQDKVFVFGGIVYLDSSTREYADFQSVLVFDTIENKALSMATIGDIPPARIQFSATPAPDGKSIVVYGGLNTSSTDRFDSSSDVYVLDTCKLEWSKPDVSGDVPSPRANHGAVTYGNYMVLLYGYTDMQLMYGNTKVPSFTHEISILDMHSWKWVNSISHQDDPTSKSDPGCSFSFPSFPDDPSSITEGDNPLPYDPTVIKNPNKPSNKGSRNKGLAIGFALFGLLLICGGLFWYFRRQRRKARALNPRWLPGAITSHKGGANNDYPLFVYNNLDDKSNNNDFHEENEKKQSLAPQLSLNDDHHGVGGDGMRTYTANDHGQWERALDQDPERPEDGRAMSRHMDVWERMRSLHDQRNP
ncbi:hypothetical protein BDB00DRAFT_818552 [Zychaea mexicana]|uniref:uncharacterized protein n=1 Tax=Zychaea mexicana TaxID=64656 RepID=UPI0022FDB3D0|nr:uncharacterized protein BDB00DRAFT_818552 [Zychaea mexicana]KAI9494560.1 hypothetical protein BDB00DRAFT_818552 [Zychaea mexicana]